MLRLLVHKGRALLRRSWRRMCLVREGPRLEQKDILAALRRLPFAPPGILMVHSSLSSCGFITGGAATVIQALREWNAGGTLAMPAHSYCYPDLDGKVPVFDPRHTPSRVGTITDAFWRQPGVVRSLHPSHSLACEGPRSADFTEGHEGCKTPCGPGTPYEKLVRADAAVLMFGVTLNAFTFLHTAEDAAGVPYLYFPDPVILRIKVSSGDAEDFPMLRQDMSVPRRFADVAGWLEERGLLYRTPLGRGELLFIPECLAVHNTLTACLREDPWFLVQPSARPDKSSPSPAALP